jgi:predicted nuclease of predicted toxin-antitoxin system
MRFLLDENVDYRLAAFLRGLGHDVAAIAHEHKESIADREVLRIALREQRILLTNDHDFGELIVRQELAHSGVVLFRLKSEAMDVKCARLSYVLDHYSDRMHQFLVLTDQRVRIRTTGAARQ